MIDQPGFWQSDLLRRAEELRWRTTQKVWREQSFGRLEQLLMIGFYCVRKLTEAQKLSNALLNEAVPVDTFTPRGKAITLLNWYKIDELYKLDQVTAISISLVDLCHQFVHSYVFCPVFEEDGTLSGVLVASDRQKGRALLHVRIADIVTLFERVGADDPNEVVMTLKPKTGDYDVVRRVRAANNRMQRTAPPRRR